MALLRDALSAVSTTGERWYEPELHRLTGELTLLSNDQSEEVRVKEAEACFQKTIDIARHQQAKFLGIAHGHEPGPPVAGAGEEG